MSWIGLQFQNPSGRKAYYCRTRHIKRLSDARTLLGAGGAISPIMLLVGPNARCYLILKLTLPSAASARTLTHMTSPNPEAAAGAAKLPSVNPRQVFVAYPYAIPKEDYRRPFEAVAKAFNVKFVYADEKISDLHILEKIRGYILNSAFGIYDISGWNPNVALELGLAFGLGRRAYIAFDPSKTDVTEVPSDLRGMDRLQYGSFAQLEERIEQLISQELPVPRTHDAENLLPELREIVLGLVDPENGLLIGDIAKALGVSNDLARAVIRPLVAEDRLQIRGIKRGSRYYGV
jgi:hypothetical protein